jgi:L-proline amide hydrolase
MSILLQFFLFFLVFSLLFKYLLREVSNGRYVSKRTGSMKDRSIENRSYKIKTPTLLINGKYDGAQDSVMEPFFNSIEKVKWARFGESSPTRHLEAPDAFLKFATFY